MSYVLSRKTAAIRLSFLAALLWIVSVHCAGAADEAAIKRGGYLFTAADCTSCHTDAKHAGRPLAGGRALDTPFGTFYGPNITPDPQFGIGQWSEADFHRALRSGLTKGGESLYPVFPFTSFTRLSDGDIGDIFAYLQAQPPVAQPSRAMAVDPPFNWRFLMLFWRALFFKEGPLEPVAGQSPEWNRGRYLAEAVGHCQECHTPRNFMGALQTKLAYSGNPKGADKQKAPNITSDPDSGIGKWNIDDIEALLESGQTPEMDYVGSGMGEVVKGTGALTPADRHALAVFIKSLPPIHTEKKPAS